MEQAFVFHGSTSGTKPPATGEPPDHVVTTNRGSNKWASFRDACVGKEGASVVKPRRDLVAERLGSLEFEEGNRLKPMTIAKSTPPVVTAPASLGASGSSATQSQAPRVDGDETKQEGNVRTSSAKVKEVTDSAGSFDLEEQLHGDWMIVKNKKGRSKSAATLHANHVGF
ncbi:hypothetical protein RIF29_04175 [Crotalaria pallida]|uniref:Uncharacterized protein n=1 Tax=Crotalaria pallida TaxID=3830 RepID=A0AAN9J0Y1_CROPI